MSKEAYALCNIPYTTQAETVVTHVMYIQYLILLICVRPKTLFSFMAFMGPWNPEAAIDLIV